MNKQFTKFLSIFAPLFLILNILLSFFFPNFFIEIATEDKFYEYIQFIFFCSASFFAFKTFKALKPKKLIWKAYAFLFLSLVLSFIALEEISWGQRLLGINTPQYIKKINLQNELTIHNLSPIQNKLGPVIYLVGLYGATSQIILKTFFKKYYQTYKIFTPPTYLWLYFLTTFIYNFTYFHFNTIWHKLISNYDLIYRWQEVAETLLSMGFIVFTIYTYKISKTAKK